jgi:hypothetical protein
MDASPCPCFHDIIITGKEWVGEMFSGNRGASGVDISVTGPNHPDYLKPPKREGLEQRPNLNAIVITHS